MLKANSATSSSPAKTTKGLFFTVSAPGKVILHGEHSVVYDKLAIAASLGLRTRLTCEFSNGSSNDVTLEFPTLGLVQHYDFNDVQKNLLDKPLPLTTSISDYNWKEPELVDYQRLFSIVQDFVNKSKGSNTLTVQQNLSLCSLFYLCTAILHSVNINLEPFTLKIETDLTVGAGTGSSASFSVTIAVAFIHYIRIKTSNVQFKNVSKNGYKPAQPIFEDLKQFNEQELALISKWAFMAEKIIHGTPSGIDNTVCTYGSVVEFRKSGGLKLIPNCEFNLLLINTQVQRNTKQLVKHVAMLREHHTQIVELILNAMDEISRSALLCLNDLIQYNASHQTEQPNTLEEAKKLYDKLGELTDINQHLLQGLGVSHPTLDKICAIVKTTGLNGKLTGAGGGGYAIALVPPYVPKQTVEQLINQLNSEGFHAIFTKLGGPGITID